MYIEYQKKKSKINKKFYQKVNKLESIQIRKNFKKVKLTNLDPKLFTYADNENLTLLILKDIIRFPPSKIPKTLFQAIKKSINSLIFLPGFIGNTNKKK